MIQTGFESRVKVQQIIESQLPSFILDENPNVSEFLKQYYISQEYQGGPIDIAENLDQYLKVDNLTPEVVVGFTTLSAPIEKDDTEVFVSNTKGFPNEYGLLKIDDEIITYTGKTSTSFTGCIRGFSGITAYSQDLNREDLVFSESNKALHNSESKVENLSSLFLKQFYEKIKYTLTNQLQKTNFTSDLNVGTFLKEATSLYKSKGTNESFRILFNVLYGETPKIVNLEDYLLKPSYSEYLRREIAIAEVLTENSNPLNLVGQTIKKSTDDQTSASISEIEPFTRNSITYYRLSLFIGNSLPTAVEGNFVITPNTKTTLSSSIGSKVITVDSTIGFSDSGTITIGNNKISYTGKTINQFLGCSGIEVEIEKNTAVTSDETYYGYENGDLNKKVELKILGILSNLKNEKIIVSEGDLISIKHLGRSISNPDSKTYEEIFANSWIYNTSSSYDVKSLGSNIVLGSDVDKSSLKIGDRVELVNRFSKNIVFDFDNPYVNNIVSDSIVGVAGSFQASDSDGEQYSLRRIINTANSNGAPIEFGNNVVFSDIQNLYTDNTGYAYVASNSLPSGEIDGSDANRNNYRYNIIKALNKFTINSEANLFDKDSNDYYSEIGSDSNVPFITGDLVYYQPLTAPLVGLETGSYYVEVLSDPKKIKLYTTNELVGTSNFVKVAVPEYEFGEHSFILYSQREGEIGVQKILKKFPLNTKIEGPGKSTIPGTSSGMLINGVEISNYKSLDKVYYGPVDSISILNGGKNYDVVNLPLIDISSDTGINAKVQPVISGTIEEIYVDYQDYDIDKVLSIDISGGNGSNVVVEPILVKRNREVSFDGRIVLDSGGIGTATNTIKFTQEHNFKDGQEVVYNSNGNDNLVIGIGTSTTLLNNNSYFVRVENNTTISLFETISDYNLGNAIGFSTGTNGIHKFRTIDFKNTLSEIKVIDGGTFTNRKLILSQSGISTITDSFIFENHGFNDRDLVEYDYETAPITGISTDKQYFVLKVDENTFKICDAGIGGTNTSNYDRKNYIKFSNTGSGYQYFKYPDITVSVKYNPVGFSTDTQVYEELVCTPKVRGSIVDLYIYNGGTGYGSTIINYEKSPSVSIKSGKDAYIVPFIVNGQIDTVQIESGGSEYYSVPDLVVVDNTGAGTGSNLRPIITNGIISDVQIINPGIGYSTSTKIAVRSAGSDAVFDAKVRSLTVNNVNKLGTEILQKSNNKLKYTVSGYFDKVRTSFGESLPNAASPKVSGIIGWAYDGNPIYGPFGYSDPEDETSTIKLISSGYQVNTSNIFDRPSGFGGGFFVEDYQFTNNGDLDDKNGRFTKTKEFPNGVYAYVACIDSSGDPVFPYFIGNDYKSKTLEENVTLNQSYDFKSSNLLRNTFPYKVSDLGAGYDYIVEIDEILKQRIVARSVNSGSVDDFEIISGGTGYKVGDSLVFNNDETGGGLNAKVSSIDGKEIVNIVTDTLSYDNAIFTWNYNNGVKIKISPNHNLNDRDYVYISGLSSSISSLNGLHEIKVLSNNTKLISNVDSATSIGGTEIYVSNIPSNLSIGSSIGIGTENLKVLNIYEEKNVLRVERGLTGTSHTANSTVTFLPDNIIVSKFVDYFDSTINDKVYFNAQESVGFGTIVGLSTSNQFYFGSTLESISVPSKSIYLKNHPFTNNQQIVYTNPGNNISISTDGINLIPGGLPSNLFVVNKGKDLIGLKTAVDSSELFFHYATNLDNDLYLLESSYNQITGSVSRIKSTVSVSTYHGMSVGDSVTLTVTPNLSVGIGTSTAIRVLRDSATEKILINPIGFSSTGINTNTNTINLVNHGLETGDKVKYSSDVIPDGLNTDDLEFFIFKLDENNIKLCQTYIDSKTSPPTVIGIGSTGGVTQSISKINPQLYIVKNNNVAFDLSDSSVSGYNFKVYFDNEFKNEFVSTGSTSGFNISKVGTALTISYDLNIPQKLYYALEKSGYISTSDKEVENYSELLFDNSYYNGQYNVVSIGLTTFDIVLKNNPERTEYNKNDCNVLKYTTSSTNSTGSINKINILSGGVGYKKLPSLSNITTNEGLFANVVPKSKTIGSLKEIDIKNDQFAYPSDPTLKPSANISPIILTKDSNTIKSVDVLDGGTGYFSIPDVLIVNEQTGKLINYGVFELEMNSGSIQFVNVVDEPKGIPDSTIKLVTVNNGNGITIQRVDSSSTGIFTCSVTKPSQEYYFNPGDQVFIEGIQKQNEDGSGFNSEDYGYTFLTVDSYVTSSPYDLVTINVSGLTTNTGIAKTIQEGSGILIDKDDYPTFKINTEKSTFLIGERLTLSDGTDIGLVLNSFDGYYLKVTNSGSYTLKVGDTLVGAQSGSILSIQSIIENNGVFDISYSSITQLGWNDNIGELNSDYQVTSDNDYYQNLSYTVKSSKEYNVLESPVFSNLHISGTKNFADTQIEKEVSFAGVGSDNVSISLYNVIEEKRVDTINNYDFVRDYNVIEGSSKIIQLQNKRLVDSFFFNSVATKVLTVDDISNQFSYFEDSPNEFTNLLKLDSNSDYYNYIIRVSSEDFSEIQLTEIVILNDGTNSFIVQKGNVFNSDQEYGSYSIYTDEFEDSYFAFTPVDPYDTNYDLKIIRTEFTSSSAGIGSTSLGFVDLISSIGIATPGVTTSIVSLDSNNFESLYANIQVIDSTVGNINFVEIYLTHDGTNTFLSEYYIDSEFQTFSLSNNFIGSFSSNISGGILSLNYTNTSEASLNRIKSNIVGFGSTNIIGVGNTYRFKSEDQFDESERSVIYQSNYSVTGTGTTALVSLDKNKFNSAKSLVEVSIGSTKAIHQVMIIHDDFDAYIQQSALLSVSGISTFDGALGIGTFGADNSASTFDLTFTADPEYASYDIQLTAFTQSFYDEIDAINDPLPLEYGDLKQIVDLAFYDAINGDRINKTKFELLSNKVQIFKKVFNPQNSSVLTPNTGTFNIKNHFFRNNEELIYTPKSSIVGLATTAMTYNDGSITGLLPSRVFAIVSSEDSFQISTVSGSSTPVTFDDLGGGNIHQFEMYEKNSKTIVVIDDLIQHPLSFSGFSHQLTNSIGSGTTFFEVSGISSIRPADILKIDDEFANVVNVGLGTSSSGPITNFGTFNLVQTERGFVGSSAESHSSSTVVDIYRGAFNIVDNQINFTNPPRGNPQIDKTPANLDYETSTFNARVFLRSDYTNNKIYDDVSNEFNGIGRTFTLKVGGANTSGIGTEGSNGLILINGIFQQPSTKNNPFGNFSVEEITSPYPGITTVVFSGITEPDSDPVVYYSSENDININETPRGGIIVSYGSTPGLGFAPLVGASLTATVGSGTITGITTISPGSGYNGLTSIGVSIYEEGHSGTPASITASIGVGGTLSFNLVSGGTGYTNPTVFVSEPSYENLPVVGISRLGIGSTTTTGIGLSISLKVAPIGLSSYFGVSEFDITKSGYSFQRGDVFKPIGLVTDSSLSSPIHDFEITVVDTYSDKFSSWDFGKLDFVDSISDYQDGERVTFPLFYNGETRSFETPIDAGFDLTNNLIIFINGILQEPGKSYIFGGGTSIQFTKPPLKDDIISIYFYKGLDADVISSDIITTIEKGDVVRKDGQDSRTVTDLSFSDRFETEIYTKSNVDDVTWRTLSWTKQKTDKKINGEIVSKSRDSLKSLIVPSAKIISDVSTTDKEIFVDDITLFEYESPNVDPFNALIVDQVNVGVGSTSQVNYVEFISNFRFINGTSNNITGIASTSTPSLGIEFTLEDVTDLVSGYPIYITDTRVGSGVTSIISNDSEVVGIGTVYLDNIYIVDRVSTTLGTVGIITCLVDSNSNLSGIDTSGTIVGKYSWGRLSNTIDLSRASNPISIGVTGRVVSGLATYPILMRRNGDTTLRSTGAIYEI